MEPRTRALRWFDKLGVRNTEENNGVLVYVSFVNRVIGIVADRDITARVDQSR